MTFPSRADALPSVPMASESDRAMIVPSDMLRSFVELLRQFPSLAEVCGGAILDVRLVLDANAIIQDAILAAKAKNPAMRPTLEELMDSGVLRCLAPDSVKGEVDEHLPRLAEALDEDRRARALSVWERYRSKVEWVDAPDYAPATGRFPGLAARDPDDLPVAAVFHVHGADGIVTDDRDLLDCPEVAAVSRQLVQLVREYARAKATAVTATTLPTFAVTGVLVAAVGIFSAIPGRWKLVAFLVVVAIAVAAVVLMSAETRASIRAAFARWLDWTTEAMPAVEAAAEHQTAIVRALPACAVRLSAAASSEPAAPPPGVPSPRRRRSGPRGKTPD